MHKIKVNNQFSFEVDHSKGVYQVDGREIAVDVSQINDRTFHLIHNHQSYRAEVVEVNRETKNCTIKVNNNLYTVDVKDQYDELLHRLGMDNLASSRIAELKAPMPGLVLNVFPKEGDEVKKGDNLLVLEAMKMENIIKAPADVTVKAIRITAGDKVEKNQVMLVFA